MNEIDEIPKLTLREKILIGASFTAGVLITAYCYRNTNESTKRRIYTRINDDLREMFDNGEIVGTGENADKIAQYVRM